MLIKIMVIFWLIFLSCLAGFSIGHKIGVADKNERFLRCEALPDTLVTITTTKVGELSTVFDENPCYSRILSYELISEVQSVVKPDRIYVTYNVTLVK